MWYDNMKSDEFEIICKHHLDAALKQESIKDYEITHNMIIPCHDGNYQIDIVVAFKFAGLNLRFICECKKYSRPVGRDTVVALKNRVDATGSQKGILMAVNGFQSGAIQFAEQHGIALINIEPLPAAPGGSVGHLSEIQFSPTEPSCVRQKKLLLLEHYLYPHIVIGFFTDEEKQKLKQFEKMRGNITIEKKITVSGHG